MVQGDAVADGVQGQSLRTSLLLMTVAVLHGQVLEEDVVGIDHHGSTYADVHGIVAS